MYGAGRKPKTDPMLTMRPFPWRRMWGRTARVIRTTPKKFVSKIDRACSIELSSAPAGAVPKPALFTSRGKDPGGGGAALSRAGRCRGGPGEDHERGRLDGRHLLHALRFEGGAPPRNPGADAARPARGARGGGAARVPG